MPWRIACLLLTLTQAGCADWFLIFPTTRAIGSSARKQLIKGRYGNTIEAWVHKRGTPCSAAHPALIEFIGNGSRAEYPPTVPDRVWTKRPSLVWRVNYPGYGGSDGPASIHDIADAAIDAYDAMAKIVGKRCPIIAVGNSLGTTAALWIARSRPVAAVVLKNPPPLKQLIIRRYGWWNLLVGALVVSFQVPPELDSVINAKHSRAPAVIFTSSKDRIVDPREQRLIVAAYRGPIRHVVLPRMRHNDRLRDGPDTRRALAWLAQHQDKARPGTAKPKTKPQSAPAAQTKPRLLDSVQWLSQKADNVILGSITQVFDNAGGGKSRGLRSLIVHGRSLDPRRQTRLRDFAVSVRDIPLAQLKQLHARKAQLLLFVRETQQAYRSHGHSWNLWPLRDSQSGRQLLITVPTLNTQLVDIATMRLIGDWQLLVARVRQSIRQRKSTPVKDIRPVGPNNALAKSPVCRGGCRVVYPATR